MFGINIKLNLSNSMELNFDFLLEATVRQVKRLMRALIVRFCLSVLI